MENKVRMLLELANITTPLIGFYDTPETRPFAPLIRAKGCIFRTYSNWLKGHSVLLTEDGYGCRGAGYWLCGVQSVPQNDLAAHLAEREGFKASEELMMKWLDNRPPYPKKHSNIIIGPLKPDQEQFLRTVTFYVNPDQLSLLVTGCEYNTADVDSHPVISAFGSGCGQLIAMFEDLSVPKAIVGATDISMRRYLPEDTLALTVTKPMFEQLCNLGENSFLYKPFWHRGKEKN